MEKWKIYSMLSFFLYCLWLDFCLFYSSSELDFIFIIIQVLMMIKSVAQNETFTIYYWPEALHYKIINILIVLIILHFIWIFKILKKFTYKLYQEVQYLHSTDDWESSEESHGSSNCRELVHKFGWPVLLDSVKCWGVKIDSDMMQIWENSWF